MLFQAVLLRMTSTRIGQYLEKTGVILHERQFMTMLEYLLLGNISGHQTPLAVPEQAKCHLKGFIFTN